MKPSRLATRSVRALPWLVLAAAVAFTAFLLSLTRPGVFYSGDAGLKSLLVEQFARGELHLDVRLPAEPWALMLWREGFYPFQPPFAYESGGAHFAACPLAFPLLTAPAYATMGWRGMYFWPVVGVLAVWTTVLWLGRRVGLGPAWTALALFAVAFCSPLTLYAAMYWEHTLGVAFAFGGLALLLAPGLRSPRANGLVAGVLVGMSVWLRSELVWLAAVTAILLPLAPRLGAPLRGRLAFFLGLSLAGAGLVVWNVAAYGSPLGMHARQVLEGADPASRAREIAWAVPRLLSLLARNGPVVILAGAGAVTTVALARGSEAERGQLRVWGAIAIAFVLGIGIVLPRIQADGGKQFGPRYLLVVFPIAAVVVAVSARALWERARLPGRVALGAALAIACLAGAWLNAVSGARDLANDYATRVAPVLDEVRAQPRQVIVVSSQYVSQDLAAAFGASRFFLAPTGTALDDLSAKLYGLGQRQFLFAMFQRSLEGDFPLDRIAGGEPLVLRLRLLGCSTYICLHSAVVAGR